MTNKTKGINAVYTQLLIRLNRIRSSILYVHLAITNRLLVNRHLYHSVVEFARTVGHECMLPISLLTT